jgi:thymidylate synthase
MATSMTVPNLRAGYVDVCRRVVLEGRSVRPRGLLTHELTDVTIEVLDPTDVLPIGVGRKLNPAIAAAEALQLIGGRSDPELMVRISKNFEQFMDGGRFWGAYGDRVRLDSRGEGDDVHQAEIVVARLKRDPDSRQALIVLWRPELDLNFDGKHDYPCTTMLMFLIREGKLQLHVTMRSNDVWWGLAYDAFQFTQLQLTVAHSLGVQAGSYYHHAVSLHAYERDFPAIGMLKYPAAASRPNTPRGIRDLGSAFSPWRHLEDDAQILLEQRDEDTYATPHPWWRDSLNEFVR